jgi:hypothetical protein
MGNRRPNDLTVRPKCNAILGELPVLQYCAVEQLCVDERYQRSLEARNSISLVRRIAANWDWGLCQPLYVARRDDGKLYVVDGQHRWAAAKLRGDVWQLPCVVRSFATPEQEAAAFVALNQERTPLTQLQIFRAATAAGDPEACGISAAIEEAGLTVATTSNNQQCGKGAVGNIGGLKSCWRVHGKEGLVASLRVLREAFPDQVLRYAGSLFPGIVALAAPAAKANEPGLLRKVVELVATRSQDRWVSKVLQLISNDPSLNRGTAAVIVFKAAQRGEEPMPTRAPAGPVSQLSTGGHAPPVYVKLDPAETTWCDQCDQRRSGAQAAACSSPFCSLKAKAA